MIVYTDIVGCSNTLNYSKIYVPVCSVLCSFRFFSNTPQSLRVSYTWCGVEIETPHKWPSTHPQTVLTQTVLTLNSIHTTTINRESGFILFYTRLYLKLWHKIKYYRSQQYHNQLNPSVQNFFWQSLIFCNQIHPWLVWLSMLCLYIFLPRSW